MVAIDQPADHRVQQDDKCSPQGAQKEEQLSSLGLLASCVIEGTPNSIESKQSCQTHGSIELAVLEVFKGIDNYPVSRSSRVEKIADTHQGRNLTSGNVDSRTCHECRDGGQGNEVNDPPAANQADKGDD